MKTFKLNNQLRKALYLFSAALLTFISFDASAQCECDDVFEPVCALIFDNGNETLMTFPNACEAECAGAFFITEGPCEVITDVFGCTDDAAINYNPNATIDDGTCIYVEDCSDTPVVAIMETGGFPSEVSWEITDSEGNVVLAGGEYTENNTFYPDWFCAADGCYNLNMYDSFGDGWNGGSITIVMDGSINTYTVEESESFAIISVNSTDCGEVEIEGCTDPEAWNYNPNATIDNGSCEYFIFGCTDPNACNFNEEANANDGSCDYECFGCTDPEAANYDEGAIFDDGSCQYTDCEDGLTLVTATSVPGIFPGEVSWEILNEDGEAVAAGDGFGNDETTMYFCFEDGCYTVVMYDSFGDGWNGYILTLSYDDIAFDYTFEEGDFATDVFGVNSEDCVPEEVFGCTDPQAINYDPNANVDDGSCEYYVFGCTNPEACNYNEEANFDDGTCNYDCFGCTDPDAINYDEEALFDDGSCQYDECEDGLTLVSATFNPGAFTSEVSWQLANEDGDIVASGGDYTNETTTDYFCLEDGCYTVLMYDSFGDGWNGCSITLEYSGIALTYTFDDGDFASDVFGVNADGCEPAPVLGCTDELACNYNMNANEEDGSCEYETCAGCTDPEALNYNPFATIEDGSCEYAEECDGVSAQLYVCTFGSAENVGLEIVDEEGNIVHSQDGYEFGIFYYDICLGEGCYTATMWNNSGETGWYGGYWWISTEDGIIVEESLDDDLSEEVYQFSIDGSCGTVYGCTNPDAINYDPDATDDDGSCIVIEDCGDLTGILVSYIPGVFGSENSYEILDADGNVVLSSEGLDLNLAITQLACLEDGCYQVNLYDAFGDGWNGGVLTIAYGDEVYEYTFDDGSEYISSFGINADGCEPIIYGCTDPEALNFDQNATEDDGSCEYGCEGIPATLYVCTFANAENVGLEILDSDGNTVYYQDGYDFGIFYFDICLEEGCYTANMWNNSGDTGWYGGYFWVTVDGVEIINESLDEDLSEETVEFSTDGSCGPVYGCTDPEACNYNEEATSNDYSCTYDCYGCTNPDAINYDETATIDDGSCVVIEDCEETLVYITMVTEAFGGEISWDITDEDNNILASGGEYDSYMEYPSYLCLGDGCYNINMYDSFGDGWNGGVIYISYDGNEYAFSLEGIDGTYSYNTFGINSDECAPIIYGCTDPEATNFNPEANAEDGSCTYAPSNDLCADATELEPGFYWISNVGAYQNEGMDGDCWGFGNGEEEQTSIWFTFTTPEEPANIVIEAIADDSYSLSDTQFGLYLECGGEMIYCDGNSGEGLLSMFDFACGELEPNTTYILQVDGYAAQEGSCFLELSYNECGGGDIFGCTDPNANNFNQEATIDDGSCEYDIYGCTDQAAINFNPWATIDDGSCEYIEECDANAVTVWTITSVFGGEMSWYINDEFGNIVGGADGFESNYEYFNFLCLEDGCYEFVLLDSFGDGWNGGFVVVETPYGTYEQTLTEGEYGTFFFGLNAEGCGSDEVIFGCTDPEAVNYNADATVDDGSCYYDVDECEDNSVALMIFTQTWGSEISWELTNGEGEVVAEGSGYDSWSEDIVELCLADGCYSIHMYDSWGDGWNGGYYMIVGADGLIAEGTLLYGTEGSDSFGINSDCEDVYGCTDPEALNYNGNATLDDGSCVYNGGIGLDPEDFYGLDLLFSLMPNPTVDDFQVDITNLVEGISVDVKIYNMLGQLVDAHRFSPNQDRFITQIDASNLERGMYLVTVTQGNKVRTEQLVKQ